MSLKINKKLLAQFDQPDALLVISLYPKKGETYSAGTTGVASYTKNLITHLNRPVVVLADYQTKPVTYQENEALVIRCFKPSFNQMWIELFTQLKSFKQARHVLIQFDFSMYGSFITSGLLLPFLAVLKVMGFEVSLVSHHVLTDVSKISGHVGLRDSLIDHLKAKIYNAFFKVFFLCLGQLTHQIIVLEDTLKNHLSGLVSPDKLLAIPHAVDTELQTMTKAAARRQLGIKPNEQVVMFFGFINWFKGADFFTETFKDIKTLNGKPARFILAGGASATMQSKAFYRDYLATVQAHQNTAHNLEITGYVPQEKIKTYFAAADLVIFPYRYFMCASGVLSLVFSYQKPFIVSQALSSMFTATDFKQAMKQVGLTTNDLSFSLVHSSAIARTEKVLANGLKAKLSYMGQIMSDKRSFQNTAILYDQALFGVAQESHTVPDVSFAS